MDSRQRHKLALNATLATLNGAPGIAVAVGGLVSGSILGGMIGNALAGGLIGALVSWTGLFLFNWYRAEARALEAERDELAKKLATTVRDVRGIYQMGDRVGRVGKVTEMEHLSRVEFGSFDALPTFNSDAPFEYGRFILLLTPPSTPGQQALRELRQKMPDGVAQSYPGGVSAQIVGRL